MPPVNPAAQGLLNGLKQGFGSWKLYDAVDNFPNNLLQMFGLHSPNIPSLTPPQQMNWKPEPNAEQLQEMQQNARRPQAKPNVWAK
jgi:hypothetical protein